jgi:Flp pilus assembly protein TadD
MDPFHAVNLNNCAWFLLTASDASLRDKQKALKLAARAARLEPRAGYILDTYAWALFRNGKTEEALAEIEKAIRWARRDNPGEGSVLRAHRARMLVEAGKRDAALKELSAVLREFRRDPELAAEAARAYCDLGLVRKALDELRRMVDLNYPDVYMLKHDPELAAARKDPGFAKLLEHAAKTRREIVAKTAAARAERQSRPARPLQLNLR